jgi:hypothetical protein
MDGQSVSRAAATQLFGCLLVVFAAGGLMGLLALGVARWLGWL